MSENIENGGRLPRPAYQRYELGPLLSVITERVFESVTEKETFGVPRGEVQGSLRILTHWLAGVAVNLVDDWYFNSGDDADLLLRAGARQLIAENYPGYTYFSNFKEVLSEGLRSGLIVPVKLYGQLAKAGAIDVSLHAQFRPNHFTDTLRTHWFDKMLHELAVLPNGALGSWSTDGSVPDGGSVVPHFEFVKQDNGWGFSENTREIFKERMREVNTSGRLFDQRAAGRKTYSGGCPVRHDGYKKIGSEAMRIFVEAGYDPQGLAAENRISIISLCREFVADYVERGVERSEVLDC
jgi:hypothetical protein